MYLGGVVVGQGPAHAQLGPAGGRLVDDVGQADQQRQAGCRQDRPGPQRRAGSDDEELRSWSVTGGTLRLGAGTPTPAVAAKLAALVPPLAEAARTVGSPQIRNAATVGGNLATAGPAGDALPVLGAVAGPAGRRRLPVGELLVGPSATAWAGARSWWPSRSRWHAAGRPT